MRFWDDRSNNADIFFAVRLQELLDSRFMSAADLEDAGVVSASSVKEYLENGRLPNVRTACKIADFFDVDLDWLFGRDDSSIAAPLLNQPQMRNFDEERKIPWK